MSVKMTKDIISKHVYVTPETWEKVVRESKEPGNQRAAGAQAGIILGQYFDEKETEDENRG